MVEAVTLEERLKQIAHANKELQTTIPWICDGLDGAIEKSLGGAPNSEFIINAEGVIIGKSFWHDPEALRQFLEEQVGRVANPTTVADLERERKDIEPPKLKSGLVPPVKVPDRMRLCEVTSLRPDGSKKPLFVKALVEAEPKLLKEGKGKLWLGFFPDPIYGMSLDNKAGSLRWELSSDDPESETIKGEAPEYQHLADVDSREFLVDFEPARKDANYIVKVKFHLSGEDESGLSERYQFHWKASTRKANRAGAWMMNIVGDPMNLDENKDGIVTRAELPEKRAEMYLRHYDLNHDKAISAKEVKLFQEAIRYPVRAE
jgi:hypothetical protein